MFRRWGTRSESRISCSCTPVAFQAYSAIDLENLTFFADLAPYPRQVVAVCAGIELCWERLSAVPTHQQAASSQCGSSRKCLVVHAVPSPPGGEGGRLPDEGLKRSGFIQPDAINPLPPLTRRPLPILGKVTKTRACTLNTYRQPLRTAEHHVTSTPKSVFAESE